ncbi:regulator of chromosome condensation (RCC1) repeat domain containing protein, partial [Acanthamoeba castellanii str. Neff]
VQVIGFFEKRQIQVVHVSAGWDHSLALSREGELWGWGTSLYDQLGFGDSLHVLAPRKIPVLPPGQRRRPTPVRLYVPQLDADETVTHLDCGAFHSVIATSKGRVWSWGAGDCGQLGARPTTAGGSAVLVAFPREGGTALPAVDKLVCGAYHSFVLSTDGALYGWGQGTDGQLGSGRRHNELTPIRVALADGQRVTDVGAGWGHSVFLTTPTRQLNGVHRIPTTASLAPLSDDAGR